MGLYIISSSWRRAALFHFLETTIIRISHQITRARRLCCPLPIHFSTIQIVLLSDPKADHLLSDNSHRLPTPRHVDHGERTI